MAEIYKAVHIIKSYYPVCDGSGRISSLVLQSWCGKNDPERRDYDSDKSAQCLTDQTTEEQDQATCSRCQACQDKYDLARSERTGRETRSAQQPLPQEHF